MFLLIGHRYAASARTPRQTRVAALALLWCARLGWFLFARLHRPGAAGRNVRACFPYCESEGTSLAAEQAGEALRSLGETREPALWIGDWNPDYRLARTAWLLLNGILGSMGRRRTPS